MELQDIRSRLTPRTRQSRAVTSALREGACVARTCLVMERRPRKVKPPRRRRTPREAERKLLRGLAQTYTGWRKRGCVGRPTLSVRATPGQRDRITRLTPCRSKRTLKLMSSPSDRSLAFRYESTCAKWTGSSAWHAFNSTTRCSPTRKSIRACPRPRCGQPRPAQDQVQVV